MRGGPVPIPGLMCAGTRSARTRSFLGVMVGNYNTPKECDNMDELYIRMCQGAREIRDTRKPKWANLKPGFEDFEVVNDNEGNRWYIETTSMEGYVLYTWLPRQEDLQAIFIDYHGSPA